MHAESQQGHVVWGPVDLSANKGSEIGSSNTDDEASHSEQRSKEGELDPSQQSIPHAIRSLLKKVEMKSAWSSDSNPSNESEHHLRGGGGGCASQADASGGGGGSGGDLMRSIADVAEIWSKGSAQHNEGSCRPCHYAHTKAGCRNGKHCEYCHIPHTSQRQLRVSATRRRQCQRVAGLLQQAQAEGRAGLQQATDSLTSRSLYLQGMVEKDQKGRGELDEDEDEEDELSGFSPNLVRPSRLPGPPPAYDAPVPMPASPPPPPPGRRACVMSL